jgi:hypothetical protein
MAFTILYTIEDGKGKTSTSEINVPSTLAFADVVTFAGSMASLIDPLIVGAIRRIGIAFTIDLPSGLNASPASGADIEEGARFQFRTENGFFSSLRLPTFLETLMNPGTTQVDLTDTDVAAFVTAMTSGIDVDPGAGTTTVAPCDKRDEDLTALDFAKEQFLSSRG